MLGLSSWEEFGRLRAAGLSYAQIGRRHGRSLSQLRRETTRVLRASARRGIALKATPRSQATPMLAFQLTYLDGWLTE
jgi:hypothetical protein